MNSRIAPFEALAQRALPVARMPDADAIDVRGLLRTFWKARLRIAGVAFACGLLVFLLISLITPTFTAYSKVMLDHARRRSSRRTNCCRISTPRNRW